jgi:hypothetical protein
MPTRNKRDKWIEAAARELVDRVDEMFTSLRTTGVVIDLRDALSAPLAEAAGLLWEAREAMAQAQDRLEKLQEARSEKGGPNPQTWPMVGACLSSLDCNGRRIDTFLARLRGLLDGVAMALAEHQEEREA